MRSRVLDFMNLSQKGLRRRVYSLFHPEFPCSMLCLWHWSVIMVFLLPTVCCPSCVLRCVSFYLVFFFGRLWPLSPPVLRFSFSPVHCRRFRDIWVFSTDLSGTCVTCDRS